MLELAANFAVNISESQHTSPCVYKHSQIVKTKDWALGTFTDHMSNYIRLLLHPKPRLK